MNVPLNAVAAGTTLFPVLSGATSDSVSSILLTDNSVRGVQ